MTSMSVPTGEEGSPRQRRTCRVLAAACLLFAALLPLLVVFALQTSPIDGLLRSRGIAAAGADMRAWQIVLIHLLAVLPVSAAAYGLWQASRCFARLAQGEYFSEAVVARLQGVGAGMLCAGVAGLLAPPLASLVAGWHDGGTNALALSLDAGVLMPLLFGAIVRQIAGVLRRAIVLARENAQFV